MHICLKLFIDVPVSTESSLVVRRNARADQQRKTVPQSDSQFVMSVVHKLEHKFCSLACRVFLTGVLFVLDMTLGTHALLVVLAVRRSIGIDHQPRNTLL